MALIKFAAEQRISPLARDILKQAARAVYGDEEVKMKKVPIGPGVLGFGVKGGILALSPKQICSVPNAISSLMQSFNLYRNGLPKKEFVYNVVETFADFQATLFWMEANGFDKPCCVDIENAPDRTLLSISVTYGQEIVVFPLEFMYGNHLKRLVEVLAGHYYIIGANWKYDAGVLLDATGIKVPVWFDTMLANHSLYPAATGQHDLKSMAQRLLGVPDWDKELHKFTGTGKKADFRKAPPEMLYKYNAYDVFYTFQIYEYMLPLVAEHLPFWTEVYWANGFIDIEAYRVRLDIDYVQRLSDVLKEEADEQLARLPEGLNPNSPQQIKAYLHSKAVMVRDTTADTLEAIQDDERVSEFVKPLLKYRKVMRQRVTYCESYLEKERDGFIRPTVNVHGTGSGRMSGSDPNVQNVPRDKKIRKCFIARQPGWVRIECDYAQAELRLQAILSGDPAMIAAFQPDSHDFFDLIIPQAFPERFPTVQAYLDYEEAECDGDEKDYRAKLKGVVYGLNFGRGARAIGLDLEMPASEAQKIIDAFLATYPVYAVWRQEIMQAAVDPEKADMLTGPYGLQFLAEVVTDANRGSLQRSALSFLPQNGVSFLCTTAAVRSNYRLRREGMQAMVNMVVHDAVYIDCPMSERDYAMQVVQEEMEKIGTETYGNVVLFAAEPAWFTRWGVKPEEEEN